MPRGMDERFDDPDENDDGDSEAPSENSSESASESEPTLETTSRNARTESQSSSGADASSGDGSSDDSLNIREDWDSATIYVEPEQSEDIEITFTRLKKQLKRDGHVLEKNKHFYHAIFEIAFDEYRDETKERIRELVKQDTAISQ